MPIGVVLGFLAALCQSISYLCTRLFVKQHRNDIAALLAASHVLMGVISIPLVLILKPAEMPPFAVYRNALLGTTGFYLLGQLFLFAALTRTEASRVSPLLGFKIVILAAISVLFMHHSLTMAQWAAVGLGTAAALLLSHSGQRISVPSAAMIVSACVTYSLSDLNIKLLVDHFRYLGVLHGALLSTGISYILCGAAGAVLALVKYRSIQMRTWAWSLPFALSWLTGVVFLFCCFALIGVVFGNIIQSTRGIMSIGMGWLLVRAGREHLEPRIAGSVRLKRIAAAILMTAAVALYLL
ncbi:MAG: DMT family transporter [Planctomycetaceae bacterium]|nr:DMT family transporter [Planctomycetaceae bacterium]